ncbi:L,D-transpeptidase family protein [Arsenophonus nasoniae]|nr:L,D-transpeptidase family protein [Arsenophonus nasoniae]QBY43620.1 putative L,D-transpeptidase YcfS [Arsenophonus nasoniae]WGL94349.1 L,D-transpeptidase family protein [Arsenophonus nasoniae]WGM00109.1 L,D-transpeptidase family protein [Arsenophonus nasoniae]WGM07622.1 L,D-transpeptidase family protein [Arsenophonus nasoniae]WGM12425.1 L,D-transpeptidase family protein [Arsenophonus nasoniae]
MKRILLFIGLLFLSGLTVNVSAAEYSLPSTTARLIGENSHYVVPNDGRPLEAIASEFQIGLLGMLEANPGTDPYLPKAGMTLIIPSQMLLPATKRDGIIVNLAELRLYYFPKGSNKVIVYPIGIGQLGANTPKMVTTVSQLIKNPTWTPTANIRKRYAADGVILPAVFPAGPDNPMGLYALRLSYGKGQYLIHGTNANFGIGLRVSSGCIRLRPEDIEALFYSIPVGTRVQVINEPIKYAKEPDGSYYIEVHQPLSKRESDDPQTMPLIYSNEFKAFLQQPGIDQKLVAQAVARRSGMPVKVNKT